MYNNMLRLLLFTSVFCNLWISSHGGFINEVCSEKNTAVIYNNKIFFPIFNKTQCIDATKISRNLAHRNIFDNPSYSNVETIFADGSGITEIFNVSKLESLNEIFLSHNRIRRFSPKVFINNKQLRRVHLSYNKIRIPRNLPLLTSENLDTLDLAYNGFRKIYQNTFKNLPSLRILYLQGNLITHIPFNTFTSLNVLKFLQLEENPLEDLRFNKPANLKAKYIIHDKIEN